MSTPPTLDDRVLEPLVRANVDRLIDRMLAASRTFRSAIEERELWGRVVVADRGGDVGEPLHVLWAQHDVERAEVLLEVVDADRSRDR
jgi:hypothetical protein